MIKRFSISVGIITLVSTANSHEINHSFNIGAGAGWHNARFNYHVNEQDMISEKVLRHVILP